MNGVNLSEDAREDLREIWEFVSAKDAGSATRLLKQITDKFDTLLSFPSAGRERNDLIVGLRSFAAGNYIIFYQPIDDGIEVLRVLHGSRDVSSAFDDLIG
ncbi:MAG: type II toxin-antitoxin system RelE/ParE family toxin [Pyrinomonadaceae bacterium MAG19_C2-C3]|nr:type II toxin-antitoxin system RelE/ParE family toxin [Pyrinomonadaceae bacterium MAG19_C2-C3]